MLKNKQTATEDKFHSIESEELKAKDPAKRKMDHNLQRQTR